MRIKILCKSVLEHFSWTRFSKWEIFIVYKLAEVFANQVFEVIKNSRDGLNFVRINKDVFVFGLIWGFLFRSIFFLTLFNDSFRLFVFFLYLLKLVFKFLLESFGDTVNRLLEFIDCSFFFTDSISIFRQLPLKIQSVFKALFINDLTHLLKDRLVLSIKRRFVKAEVLVVQNEAFILLFNLCEQILTKTFNLAMQVNDFVSLVQFLFRLLSNGSL